MRKSLSKKLHGDLVKAFGDVKVPLVMPFEFVYNPSEYAHPETIIGLSHWNVEIIYLDDVILVQENGLEQEDGGLDELRTAFVWLDLSWEQEVRDIILKWRLLRVPHPSKQGA